MEKPPKATKAKTPKEPAFPLYEGLTEKKMRALGEKLDALLDPNGFKHHTLLGKHTDGPNKPLLWHLVRHGLVARSPRSAGLYDQLGEYIPDTVTAADVIAVLRHVPEDMGALDRGEARQHTMLTPGVLGSVDHLIVHAYLADPAAIRAVQPELPRNVQIAIDFVRRRAGEAIDPAHARAILEQLAVRHAEQSLALNIDVPRIVDGQRVERRLADADRVRELAGLFGSPGAWAELQLAWLRAHVEKFRLGGDHVAPRTVDGLRIASLRDVLYLFGDGYWKFDALLQVLDARADAPEALLAAADELLRAGLAPFRIDVPQAKDEDGQARADDGDDGDSDDDDSDDSDGDDEYEYGGGGDDDDAADAEEEPDAGPDNDRVRALAEGLTVVAIERLAARGQAIPPACDEAIDLDRMFDSDPQYVVRVRAALTVLGPARAHAVIRRVLAKQFFFGKAAALVDVCYDPELVEAALDRLEGGDYGVYPDLLGFCGPRLIPALAAHAARVTDPKQADGYREAINYILARAAAAGETWDPALDEQLELRAIRFSYGGSKVTPILALLDGLPLDRYERVMRGNLPRCANEPWTLVRCLRADTPDALLLAVFTALMQRAAGVSSGCLGERLRALGTRAVAPLREAFGDTPAQGSLMRELERALDHAAFNQFKDSLGRPIETREQELRRLCEGLPGPKVRIYRLARAERRPAADEVGRIGGAPRGVKDADVPQRKGEAMTHMLTLDLARMPELRGPAGARSVSLYLPDPEHGAHHRQGQLLWRTEAELADAPGAVDGASAIEVEALDVPQAIFDGGCEGDLKRVRSLVYGSRGYALGGPLWLQDGPEGVDPGFLFQFDEGLCPINLGDCGVMYVFAGEIDWQCH